MAEEKKAFVMYADWIATFNLLSDEESGRLIKHIFSYVNDENPEFPKEDRLLAISFEPIKNQLKRDLKKYESKKAQFSVAGKESAKVRRLSTTQVYVLRFYSSSEQFIKVGVTDNSIGRRYSSSGIGSSKLGYKFDIIAQFFPKENGYDVLEMESFIKNKYHQFQYTPNNKFGGYTECYLIDSLQDIITDLTKLNDVEHRSTDSTVKDIVKDTVTVIVTDTVKESVINNIGNSPTQNFSFGKQPIEVLKKNCAGHTTWLQSIGMKNSLLMPQVLEWFEAFCLHLAASGKTEETEQEFKRYCASWIASEVRQGRKPITTPPPEKKMKIDATTAIQSALIKKYGKQDSNA
ncbi:hypothetical protein BC792_12760 [Sphingobacterium allocomposti]|uniref:Meiotically Up-regulated Gene 113 (MUG113) protein n=1 Tax=Sphingobacterium allocomposti TaxID=415956 RepID=A0A5S5D461_9SPHI|nr:DUF6291 domain-containing protein [Sphingobacterium composti Yoo et al. 2007 non Ten et al. 2007]TYP89459.1 hypothetical protein BC792_12760 [Sphingobacterium composti Yoo et al. 2007 non Ten et al. 2007]